MFSFNKLHSTSLSSSAVRSSCKLTALVSSRYRKNVAPRYSLARNTWPRVKPDAPISAAQPLLTDSHVYVDVLVTEQQEASPGTDSAFVAVSSWLEAEGLEPACESVDHTPWRLLSSCMYKASAAVNLAVGAQDDRKDLF